MGRPNGVQVLVLVLDVSILICYNVECLLHVIYSFLGNSRECYWAGWMLIRLFFSYLLCPIAVVVLIILSNASFIYARSDNDAYDDNFVCATIYLKRWPLDCLRRLKLMS